LATEGRSETVEAEVVGLDVTEGVVGITLAVAVDGQVCVC